MYVALKWSFYGGDLELLVVEGELIESDSREQLATEMGCNSELIRY
jgi:hypothetical protein